MFLLHSFKKISFYKIKCKCSLTCNGNSSNSPHLKLIIMLSISNIEKKRNNFREKKNPKGLRAQSVKSWFCFLMIVSNPFIYKGIIQWVPLH